MDTQETTYQPRHLKRWQLPAYYFGEVWPEYYVFLGRNRDSDNLDNSNFDCALKQLGGESDTVIVVIENHWAVGWVQWIAIHESDESSLMLADDIADKLGDYPVLDADDYSEREWKDFSSNCEQAIKDYCNDYHKRFSRKLVKAVMDMQNECSADTWPDESDITTCYAELYPKHQGRFCNAIEN